MKKSFFFAVLMLLALGAAQAQARFNNYQWSLSASTMTVPAATFYDLNGQTIALSDSGTMMPLSLGLRLDREIIASDLAGLGWNLGGGVRHTGWKATIPALTANIANSGLAPDEDWNLDISLLGWWAEAGAFGALHIGSYFELYAGLGFTAQHYWCYNGKATSASRTDEEASDDENESLASTLLGAYGTVGMKVIFKSDFFVSLSARYTYGLNDATFDGLFNWDASAYSTRVTAPFANDISVMLGVGIMIED